jgi:hypothetical protein
MKLTEKQKNCQYCHKPFKTITKLDDYKTRITQYIRDQDHKEFYCLETYLCQIETNEKHIVACPVCGRDLRGDDETGE